MINKRKALVQISARVSEDVLSAHTKLAKQKKISLSEHVHIILDDILNNESKFDKNLSLEDYISLNGESFDNEIWEDVIKKIFAIGTSHFGRVIYKQDKHCVVLLERGTFAFCTDTEIFDSDNLMGNFTVYYHTDNDKIIHLRYDN